MADNKRIMIDYTLTAPLSHIGETSSTGTIFQSLDTSAGRVPVVTGNSIRGILRDCGARRLLGETDTKVNKEIFNVLFSGGNLSGATKNDVARCRAIREYLPFVSLFGGGIGSMILAGKLDVGFAYPVCRETELITGIEAETSWKTLIDEMEFTRTDDAKDDKLNVYMDDPEAETKAKASTQMRYSVQYLAPGTRLHQVISLHPGTTDAELGALLLAISDWFERPVMGGMANKGFGRFSASITSYIRPDGEMHNEGGTESGLSDYARGLTETYRATFDGAAERLGLLAA